MSESLPFIMPPEANIIPEWVVYEDDDEVRWAFPSWSVKHGKHICSMDKFTRAVSCDCEKFTKWNAVCHHIRGSKWAMTTPRKKKRKGMTDTQLESFFAFTPEDLATRRKQVFDVIYEHGPLNLREIALEAKLPVHCVTGRLMDLRNMGFVENDGEAYDQVTDRRVKLWNVV